MEQKYEKIAWRDIMKQWFLHVWDEITSLPDYEMGSHGNQGSGGRCSEREESTFLDTWSVTCKARQDRNYPGMQLHLFAPSLFVWSLYIRLYSSVVLLTPNQINSTGDTLYPAISSRVFHPADLLSACKDVITGASEIMRAGDERRGWKTE